MSINAQAIGKAISDVIGHPRSDGRWRLASGTTVWLSTGRAGVPSVGISANPWTQPSQWQPIASADDLEGFIEQLRCLTLRSIFGS
jgi:hypothetical protein